MKPQKKIILISVIVGAIVWLLDSIVDYLFFYQGFEFSHLFIKDVPKHEIITRTTYLLIFIVYGVISSLIVRDRERASKNLELSQENLKITLNSIGDGVLVTDKNGLVTRLNPIAEQLTGWSDAEARGRHVDEVFNIINEYTRKKAINPVDRVLSEGCIVGLANHTALINRNGNEISIADSGAPIKDNSGAITGCILVFRDVTEERDYNRLIVENERKFGSIINHTSDGIYLLDENGRITEWNRGQEIITGLSKADVIGNFSWDIFYDLLPEEEKLPEKHELIKYGCLEAIHTGKADFLNESPVYKISLLSGFIKQIEQSYFTIPWDHGYRLACISRDITDNIEYLKRITENEEKFRKIYTMSPDVILITGFHTGLVIDVNNHDKELFGYKAKDIIGKKITDLNIWKSQEERNQFLSLLKNDEFLRDFEIDSVAANGVRVIVSISSSSFELNGEKAIITHIRDITEKKNYENQLISYQQELEAGIKDRTIELEEINENLKNEIYERESIQTALRISEEKYRTLLNQLPVGIYRTTVDGRFLQANPALASILGFNSVEELLDASVFSFYEKPSNRTKIIEKLKQKDDLLEEEYELIRYDNKRIYVRDLGKLIYKKTQKEGIDYIDGILIDITESKMNKEELERSEMRYRQLFENLNDIYFNLTTDGIMNVISPSVSNTIDYTPEDLIGKKIDSFIEDEAVSKKFLARIKRLGRVNDFILPVKKKDKSTVYLSANVRLLIDKNRKVYGIEGIARDITNEIKHKKLTSVLYSISKSVNTTESVKELYSTIHASLSEIIDTKNFFIAICDHEKKKISFPHFVDEVDESIPDIDMDSPISLTARVINSGEPLFMNEASLNARYQETVPLGTQSKIWLAVPLKTSDKVIGAIGVQSYDNPHLYNDEDLALLESISYQVAVAIDRKRAQVALNFQIDFLQNLIDTIPNPIYYKDKSLKYVSVNKAFEEFFGLKRNEVKGKTAYEIFPYEQAVAIDALDKEIMNERVVQVHETTDMNASGELRNLLMYKSCYLDSDGNLAGIVGIKIDITDRKNAEEEMKSALAKEHELNELKSRFIAMVSHEYRTPLTAIILSTELLSEYGDRLSEDNKLKHFDRIRQSIKTMNSLLDDIILYNKIDMGKSEFNPCFVDLEQVCLSLTHEMQFLAKNKCMIDLTINNGNVLAYLDEKILRQTLVNLLSNSVKYSNSGSTIEFEVNVEEEAVEFVVRDYGIGIPEDEQAKLFDPFFRGRNISTISGTGLGLSIVKNSIDIHGGKLTFDSKENVGTTFYVTIPFIKPAVKKEKILSSAETYD